jgi:hypothetical protein
MNTKILMTASATVMGLTGTVLIFLPNEVAYHFEWDEEQLIPLVLQILGALYFAFAMLNWMTRTNLIGGIYGRPVAMANLVHFLVGGLALIKGTNLDQASLLIWAASSIYGLLAISFGAVHFIHPVKEKAKAKE